MEENYKRMHDDMAEHDDADFLKKESEYLRRTDFEDWTGTDFEIVAAEREREITGDKGKKSRNGVLHLRRGGLRKIFILNATNRMFIIQAHGRKPSQWIGKHITIWVDETVMRGKEQVGGMRVRPTKPKKQQPKPKPSDERAKIEGIIRGFKMADTPEELKAAWVKGLASQAAIDEVTAAYKVRHEQIAKEQGQPEPDQQTFEGVGPEPMAPGTWDGGE